MKDEELLVWKDRLMSRLVCSLNRHFYPLACESFSRAGVSLERAFLEKAQDILPKAAPKALGAAVRKYVHFRLALADRFLRSEAEGSPFLSFALAKEMDLDVTHQMAGSFASLREVLPDFFLLSKEGAGISSLVSFLEKEIGISLSPLADFFRVETEGYLSQMRADAGDFLSAMALCDPDFKEEKEKLPYRLAQALAEEIGLSYSDQVWESAQMMASLDKAARNLISTHTPAAACFLYRYALFRMEVLAFYGAYLWQDRKLKDAFFRGCLKGKAFTRWVKRMHMRGLLTPRDLYFSEKLYLKMNLFMRQWAFFDPKNRKYYFKYFPNFTLSIEERTDEPDFDKKVWLLLEDLRRSIEGKEISPPFLHFLVQETRTYMVNMAHTMYFAYTMGLKRPGDFVAGKYRVDDAPSLLNQIKRFFGKG